MHAYAHDDVLQVSHLVYLAGPLTVMRNSEYFRKCFGASYRDKRSGKIVWPALRLLEPRNLYWEESYGIWMAIRHPDVALYVDFSRQVRGGSAVLVALTAAGLHVTNQPTGQHVPV